VVVSKLPQVVPLALYDQFEGALCLTHQATRAFVLIHRACIIKPFRYCPWHTRAAVWLHSSQPICLDSENAVAGRRVLYLSQAWVNLKISSLRGKPN